MNTETYIENDKEDKIDTVQSNEHSEKPPISFAGKKQGEASTGMIEQKPQFLPDTRSLGHKLGRKPDDKAKHAGKPGVSDDDEERAQQQRQNRELERHHRVWRQCKAKIVEHGCWREEPPPDRVGAHIVNNCRVVRVPGDPWRQAHHAKKMEADEVDHKDDG